MSDDGIHVGGPVADLPPENPTLAAQEAATRTGLTAISKVADLLDRTTDDEQNSVEIPRDLMRHEVLAFCAHVQREHDPDLEDTAEDLIAVREARAWLADAERSLENRCGSLMKRKRETLDGLGTLERRKSKREVCDDEAGLLRLVLDSRHLDEETGEVESPADAIVAVYGSRSRETGELRLPGRLASKGALRERGIDPDGFFEEVEDKGWSVRVVSA